MKKLSFLASLALTTLVHANPTCEITYHQYYVEKHCHKDDANYCEPVILSKEIAKETIAVETDKECYDTTRAKILDSQAKKKVSQHLYFASYVFTGNPPPVFKMTDKDGSITVIKKPKTFEGVLDEKSDPEFPEYNWHRKFINERHRIEDSVHDWDAILGGMAGPYDTGSNYISVSKGAGLYPCKILFLYNDSALKNYKHASNAWNEWEKEFFSWMSRVNPSFVRMNSGEYVSAETNSKTCGLLADIYFKSFKEGTNQRFPNQDISLYSKISNY